MKEIKATTGRIVVLGRRDENLARCVTFYISEWQELYGEGTVQLLHQRYRDTTPYPVAVTVKDGIVRWEVKEADVAVPGEGKAELQYHVGDTVVKSDTYRTLVMPALGAAGPVPPDPEKNWVDKVLEAGQAAVDASVNSPKIGDNGNWWVWDFDAGKYVDTGVGATGPQGEQGEQGVSGVYCGVEEPSDDFDVWIDPSGTPDLPGTGGFPVVEIENLITGSETPLTEAQNALISELIDNNMPFLLKVHIDIVDFGRIYVCGITMIASTEIGEGEQIKSAVLQIDTINVMIRDGYIYVQPA